MVVEKKLGTEDNPDIIETGGSIEVIPEKTTQEQLAEALDVVVAGDEIIIGGGEQVEEVAPEEDFFANLADSIDDDVLSKLSSDLLGSIKNDLESRSEWEKTYIDGLKYLGMKFDDSRSQPFEGSTGVIHPILAEAVTQFQAQAYKELLPAKGPVKTQIIGARTAEVESQSERVQEFMNYYIMNVMQEYDPELDQLLFYLPLAGSAFKKI